MKLIGDISVNDGDYRKGTQAPWYKIYPFFLFHMGAFGVAGFFMAYGDAAGPLLFQYAHSAFAIVSYTLFYLSTFGRDEVKWMFINAALGFFGIYSQIDWLLSFFGKKASDYPFHVHVIPFMYFVLYTFLIRQAFIDLMMARYDEVRRKKAELFYVAMSTAVYGIAYFFLGR